MPDHGPNSLHHSPRPAESDRFGSIAEKYQFLLQLPPDAEVGLTGPYWETLEDDFRRSGMRPQLRPEDPGALAAHMVELDTGWSNPLRYLARLGRPIKGTVLLRWHGWPATRVVNGSRKLMAGAGLQLQDFTPAPSLESVEAYLAGTAPDAETWRLRRRYTLPGRAERQRFFFLAPIGNDGFTTAGRLLEQATGEASFLVERYHLRRRGAMVFVLRSGDQRIVLRVATNSEVATLVEKNRKVTGMLRTTSGIDSDARCLIPESRGEAAGASVRAFAEAYCPGRLAWTIYREAGARSRIDRDLFRFSHAFQRGTAREVELTIDHLKPLLDGFLQPLVSRLGSGAAPRLADLTRRLRGLLEGRRVMLCAAHGDYGVGNALATSEGDVTAIIDWDQFHEADVPGVDWCDYRLKAEHYRRSMAEGLRELIAEATGSGYLAREHRGFGSDDFGLRPSDLRLIPCLAVLREMSRSARFPGELQRPEPYYTGLLDQVAQQLPDAP